MAERNYMNSNELFPILDLINRKMTQGKGVSVGGGSEGDVIGAVFDTTKWEVETFEVVRDTENLLDPEVIKQVIIVYRNGAIETIDLHRGLVPPVDSSVDDYEYINNLMIVGVTMYTVFGELHQEVKATIVKENGYGNFIRVDLEYAGELEEELEPEEGYENPNDFYDNAPPVEEEDEDEIPEDYEDYEYSPSDEPQMPTDGWVDGNPSDPVDVDVEEELEEEI